MSFENVISKLEEELKKELKEEGIDDTILDMVDLSIAYSPVIPIKNSSRSYEVKKTYGGKYLIINCPFFPEAVDEDTIKEMRARFLLYRDRMRPNFPS